MPETPAIHMKGTRDLPAKVLLAYLLFTPEDCVRVPIKMPPSQSYKVLCTHGDIPRAVVSPDKEVQSANWNEVDIRRHEYLLPEMGGDVWAGQCKMCGKVYYATIRRVKPRTKTAHQIVLTPKGGGRG